MEPLTIILALNLAVSLLNLWLWCKKHNPIIQMVVLDDNNDVKTFNATIRGVK